jgi:hypothetical protein
VRGRMNATIMMVSQGAMVLGGLIWSSSVAVAGASYTLVAAAALFLVTLFLTGRLSINFTANLKEGVSSLSVAH